MKIEEILTICITISCILTRKIYSLRNVWCTWFLIKPKNLILAQIIKLELLGMRNLSGTIDLIKKFDSLLWKTFMHSGIAVCSESCSKSGLLNNLVASIRCSEVISLSSKWTSRGNHDMTTNLQSIFIYILVPPCQKNLSRISVLRQV